MGQAPVTLDRHWKMGTNTVDGLLNSLSIIAPIKNEMQVLYAFSQKIDAGMEPVQPLNHQFVSV